MMACAHTGRTGRQSAHPAGLARLRTRPWPIDRPGPPTPASGSTRARRRRWRWVGPSATTGVRAARVDARLVRSVRWRAVIIWRCGITNLESKNIPYDTSSRPRLPSDGAALPVRPIEYGPLAAAARVALVRRANPITVESKAARSGTPVSMVVLAAPRGDGGQPALLP